MALLHDLESAQDGTRVDLTRLLDVLPFTNEGLIPAIAQDATSHEVLMLAWMDRTAIERTIKEGYATYWSRSRGAYWRKGESSGHLQALESFRFDCDGDAILLQVHQTGPACHTNRPNCFYLEVDGNTVIVRGDRC
ncbi:MAG: phosphoribosyl-AMP cyclohydrolase [Gammaproteobacteria bacterium]|nr:phosphoribosyl-AMP cyclohydrolase [Gammaproteobacteria bacterium]